MSKPGDFQPGCQLWKLRKNVGRKRKYATPNALWNACVKYFEWVESSTISEEKAFAFNGKVITGKVNKMRAMTKEGLYLHLQIDRKTWDAYADPEQYSEDYAHVCETVENIIYEHKFTGAAAGALNASIIQRDLGLKDSTSSELSGPGGGPIKTTNTFSITPVKAVKHPVNEDGDESR